jgi:transcriptional regulator with XRE-family HTH domain
MANERLRKAMATAHKSVQDLSEATGVNEKTVQRWLAGRVPHARHRWAVASLLVEDERFLWPTAEGALEPGAATTAEVVATYAHRADVPTKQWWDLIVGARRQVDLLAYAMLFLPEAHPRLPDLLRGKAAADCKVRILLGDPDSRQVAERDAEERLGGALVSRIRNSLVHFASLAGCEGVEIRLHATPLYNSTFRCDEEMFVTPHLYGAPGSWAPLLHLRRLGAGGMFDRFAQHLEDVWAISVPWEPSP